MIDGVKVRMGGREWVIAPLTLGQLRRLWPQIQRLGAVGAGMDKGDIAIIVELVTNALQRNYPDLTPAKVEDLLDLGNAGIVLNAVLTGSGLGPAMGEAVPAARSGENSAGFMPNSPPAADTASP